MNHIYILYIIAITIILILVYLTINVSKEQFHEDYTLSYTTIRNIFKELYNNILNSNDLYLSVDKTIYSMNKNNLPAGWGGGIRTWDIYASGKIGIGDDAGNVKAQINNDSSASFCNGQFTIGADGKLTIRNKYDFSLKTTLFQTHDRFTIAKADDSESIHIYNGENVNFQNYLYFPYVRKWFGIDNK